jgi:class 3 adenylate cyclase
MPEPELRDSDVARSDVMADTRSRLPAVFRYAHAVRHRLMRVLRGDGLPQLGPGLVAGDHSGPAVHRTIVVVDVAGFGNNNRTNAHQLVVRRSLYKILRQAFDKAGVTWAACDNEDRGDGVLILVPPSIVKSAIVEQLPRELAKALRMHNRGHCPEEQIRLRMSLHAGEIHYDEHGVVGRAVNLAFRLLDDRALRDVLVDSADPLAIIASSWFFHEVIWHSRTAQRETYEQVRVQNKETDVSAWIRGAGGS